MQQQGWCVNASTGPNLSNFREPEPAFIKAGMTRIYFDQQVGALVDVVRINVGEVEKRGDYFLGAVLRVERKLGHFAQSLPRATHDVNLVVVKLIRKQTNIGIQAE